LPRKRFISSTARQFLTLNSDVSAVDGLGACSHVRTEGYYFVAEVRPIPGLAAEPSVRVALLKLAVAILAAGFLSLLLARHFAEPIRTLQTAPNRLADGDLSVRAAPSLPNRQDELSDLEQDFDRMAARMQSLIHTRQELLGDISHELRSPLTPTNVALELVRRGDNSGLPRMREEIEKLEALISQILILTRIDLRKAQKVDQSIELLPLIQSIVQDANFEGAPQGRNVVIPRAVGCSVIGDAALLRSCIENVVRNAVRYAPAQTFIETSLQLVPDGRHFSARISVRDRGPGVPSFVAAVYGFWLFEARIVSAHSRNSLRSMWK